MRYEFTGDKQSPKDAHPDAPRTPEPYIAGERLKRAVNLAIHLERPLLLEGEAGCGKTRLARAVAYELGLPFYPWYVNSKTTIESGLYRFDAIGRLYDAQVRGKGETTTRRDPDKPVEYVEDGQLARAFKLAGTRAVVLIDEIDKAGIDFPNDLLTALDDDYKFTIPETSQLIEARSKPIIFITSNREKGDLPEPFLRRCLYFYVEFPGKDDLKKIVAEHAKVKSTSAPAGDLLDAALGRFEEARDAARSKKPGTSEFLDWMKSLQTFDGAPYPAAKLAGDERLPFPETLFKTREDFERWR